MYIIHSFTSFIHSFIIIIIIVIVNISSSAIDNVLDQIRSVEFEKEPKRRGLSKAPCSRRQLCFFTFIVVIIVIIIVIVSTTNLIGHAAIIANIGHAAITITIDIYFLISCIFFVMCDLRRSS
jgi:cytochrome c biogenesis factor